MSMFVGFESIMPERKRIKVDYIVPERITEMVICQNKNIIEVASFLGINFNEFKKMIERRKDIPEEFIFKLMYLFNKPKDFFYYERWKLF